MFGSIPESSWKNHESKTCPDKQNKAVIYDLLETEYLCFVKEEDFTSSCSRHQTHHTDRKSRHKNMLSFRSSGRWISLHLD